MRTAILKSLPLALSLLLAGAAHAQVKLAVAGPVTGANAAFGAQLTQGVQQAVEDINKAGGILGQKIQVEVGDDVSDPKQGVSVANKFVGDGVKFVVGHFNSGVTMPASDVYAENGVLFITRRRQTPRSRTVSSGMRSAPADATISRAWFGPSSRATSSKARRSRSFTTRPRMAKALPTPRSTTCTSSASRRFSRRASTPEKRTIRPSSPRSRTLA